MLGSVFGEDEHTAADGPYVRVLKTRKWLYLLSIAAVGLAQGFYDPDAAKALIKVTELPTRSLSWAAFLGLGYLGLQYLILILQLFVTYDIILNERLTFRRADELAKAVEQEREARAELISARSVSSGTLEALNKKRQEKWDWITQIRNSMATWRQHPGGVSGQDIDPSTVVKYRERLEISEAQMNKGFEELAKIDEEIIQANMELADAENASQNNAEKKLERATADLAALTREQPAKRFGYQTMERIFDIIRVGAPFCFAGYAFYQILFKVILIHPAGALG